MSCLTCPHTLLLHNVVNVGEEMITIATGTKEGASPGEVTMATITLEIWEGEVVGVTIMIITIVVHLHQLQPLPEIHIITTEIRTTEVMHNSCSTLIKLAICYLWL